MFLQLHDKISVDDNTLHVQSGVTISTDGDFSEGETLFVTPVAQFYDNSNRRSV